MRGDSHVKEAIIQRAYRIDGRAFTKETGRRPPALFTPKRYYFKIERQKRAIISLMTMNSSSSKDDKINRLIDFARIDYSRSTKHRIKAALISKPDVIRSLASEVKLQTLYVLGLTQEASRRAFAAYHFFSPVHSHGFTAMR